MAANDGAYYLDGSYRLVDFNGQLITAANPLPVTITGSGGAVDTELPTASVLVDDTANPTAPAIGSFLCGFDNANNLWDKVRISDATNGNLCVTLRSATGTSSPNISTLADGESSVTVLSVGSRGSRFSDTALTFDRERSWIGVHANAWNAVSVAIGGTSTVLDAAFYATISVFGNASEATTIIVQFSQNNTNYFDSSNSTSLGGGGDFGFTFPAGSRYVRLKSTAAAIITATVAGKGI